MRRAGVGRGRGRRGRGGGGEGGGGGGGEGGGGGGGERGGGRGGARVRGAAGEPAAGLSDFYRKAWAKRSAGDTVPLDVMQDNDLKRVEIKSMNRMDHLKLKSTF